MKSAIYGTVFMLALGGAFSIIGFHHAGKTAAQSVHEADQISGEWDAWAEAFGTKTAFKIKFKLDGEKVTGTIESGHTGAGAIRDGAWKNNKLSFIANFDKHESISFKGELKNNKITGQYATEGRVSPWEAVRKSEAAKNNETKNSTHQTTPDEISGEWEALLVAQETSAPVLLKLKLEGNKVTGTGESDHLGTGTIEDGSWTDRQLSFKLKVDRATIIVTGVLRDGKLVGEFKTGQMSGKWEATKK